MNENARDIKDVDFEDVNEIKITKDKRLYFSTSQVATMLDIPESTVRYYAKFFDNLLGVEYINKQRKFKESDIEKLKFISELKNEGMSLQQIKIHCDNTNFENGIQIKESSPLSIQALAKALLEEQSKQFEEQFKKIESMKEDMLKMLYVQVNNQLEQIQTSNEQMKEQILESVSTTVDEIVSEKLQAQEDRLVNELKNRLDQHKAQSEQQQEKKGFFKKIFG